MTTIENLKLQIDKEKKERINKEKSYNDEINNFKKQLKQSLDKIYELNEENNSYYFF